MKRIVVLGCTGSIGEQALDVISKYPGSFRVTGMSATGSRTKRLIDLIHAFKPETVCITDERFYPPVRDACAGLAARIGTGRSEHLALARGESAPADMVLSAISGTAGVEPTCVAVEAGLDIALANKETMVTAGELVSGTVRKTGIELFPVDSEHSAIRQCLNGIDRDDLRKIILTCSGGPFLNRPGISLDDVTPEEALTHPTWSMGTKITVDSATLMNKGLEVIEARWLFDIDPADISVLIHPESIIHSMIECRDGAVMAQMSLPDMRLPILYALSGGRHPDFAASRLNLAGLGALNFRTPDTERFPCLNLAYDALKAGGTMPAVLNAANEAAVHAFVAKRIPFTRIPEIIAMVMARHSVRPVTTLSEVLESDRWAKETAERILGR
ncbi:1-deoxy-D-xylulose-5-phosphate reductoisomerase [bacterium]|nr:1-deoxy-D-xylulose-5-phosphate reductoisomerase [candidate division CSSED10-310 bacterium]